MSPERPVLLYDGECRFCRFTARVLSRLDRHGELALLPLQDAEAPPLLAPLCEEKRMETWRLARSNDGLTGYGAGVPELLGAMRATRLVGSLLGHVPDPVLDRIYGLIARRRGSLGRLVPDGRAPRRFP